MNTTKHNPIKKCIKARLIATILTFGIILFGTGIVSSSALAAGLTTSGNTSESGREAANGNTSETGREATSSYTIKTDKMAQSQQVTITSLEPIHEVFINPEYADWYDASDLKKESQASDEEPLVGASYSSLEEFIGGRTVYTDIQEAAAALRQGFVNREETVEICYKFTTGTASTIMGEIYDNSVLHTGNPKEGDYISHQCGGYSIDGSGVSVTSSGVVTYYYIFSYTMGYFTTAAQEAIVDAEVASLLQTLQISSKNTDYLKLKTIYDYVCRSITYDHEHVDDDSYVIAHSAYGAIHDKTCVCQGYALLMYRLLLECGIDARYISGTGISGGSSGPHGWNIVKLGSYYYNFDSTWDAGRSTYGYFLIAPATFNTSHVRRSEYSTAEFNSSYPMSTTAYGACNGTHSFTVEKIIEPATCTTAGRKKMVCVYGDAEQAETEIPALSHSYNAGTITTPATCTAKGVKTYTCTRTGCTYSYTEDVAALNHAYNAGTITTPATCKAKGIKTYTCTRSGCTHSYTEDVPALNHTYDAGTITTPATCAAKGVKTYTCTRTGCTHSYTEDIDKLTTHTAGSEIRENEIAATCTTAGSYDAVVKCSVCNTEMSRTQKNAAALNHAYNAGTITTPATCKAKGVKTYTCTRSGCTHSYTEDIDKLTTHTAGSEIRENEIAATCTTAGSYDAVVKCSVCNTEMSRTQKNVVALNHTYDAGTITTPATCKSKGVKTYTCTRSGCTHSYTEDVPALNHAYNAGTITTPATCTAKGVKTYTCTRTGCTHSYTENVPALNHAYNVGTITTPATCENQGVKTYTCTRTGCTHSYTEDVPALNHAYNAGTITTPATCENQGVKTYTCTRSGCTHSYTEDVAALNHAYNVGTITTPATCKAKGVKTYTCTRTGCTHSYTEDVAKLNTHTAGSEIRENEIAATCTTAGSYDVVVKCSVCNTEMSRTQKSIGALSHAYNAGTITAQPTCENQGVKTYTCTRSGCTHSYTEDVAALNHTYNAGTITAQPTCENQGVKTYTCTRSGCTHSYTEDIAALGHSYDAGTITTPPTYKNKGVKTYTCTRTGCGQTKTEDIDQLPSKNLANCQMKLAYIATTYTGKALKPKVILYDGTETIPSSCYTIKYSANKAVGIATVTVTGCGNGYEGTNKATFTINPTPTSISKATAKTGGKMTVSWKKKTQNTTGYELQISTKNTFPSGSATKKITIKSNKSASTTIKGLKKKTQYYLRIRTYTVVKKKTYYSTWSTAKKVKTK